MVNRLNGSKVRLYVTPARSYKGVQGLAEAAKTQVGLRKVVVNAHQITGYLGNGRVVVLRPVGEHNALYNRLKNTTQPFRANVTYRLKVLNGEN